MKIFTNPLVEQLRGLVKRPSLDFEELESVVGDIFSKVASDGDAALREYSAKFDKVNLQNSVVSAIEIQEAEQQVPEELKAAIQTAYNNIYKFHEAQIVHSQKIETTSGVLCWQKSIAIESVGLYIPGGTAPLFSTVLMLGIPAKIAGCSEVILCTPPQKNGEVHPAVIYTAQKCGIDNIFKIGGAQAIAAMTLGTESIPKVSKVFGPGNQYVTAGKRKAMDYGVAIDLPAGPSEVLVYADETGIPEFIAADLLSQAEHGIDSQVVLVTTSKDFAKAVISKIEKQSRTLPRREIVERCLENSATVIIGEVKAAFDFINDYAPEHLIVASNDADQYIKYIRNAGSVFLGNYSPESAGDYASGTNHTLPTSGFAKSYSGTNLDGFVKKITFQKLSKEGMRNLGQTIITMAQAEELEAHARAVEIRLEKQNQWK